jgi:hypothetical protein
MNKSPIPSKIKKVIYKKGIMSSISNETELECNLLVSEYEKLVKNETSGTISYFSLYNTFLKLSIKKEYKVVDTLFIIVKREIENTLKSTQLESSKCIDKLISDIKRCEILIERTKSPLLNNISRFDKEAIPKINTFNTKLLILDYLKSSNILLKLKEFVICREQNYSDQTNFKVIHLIVSI